MSSTKYESARKYNNRLNLRPLDLILCKNKASYIVVEQLNKDVHNGKFYMCIRLGNKKENQEMITGSQIEKYRRRIITDLEKKKIELDAVKKQIKELESMVKLSKNNQALHKKYKADLGKAKASYTKRKKHIEKLKRVEVK